MATADHPSIQTKTWRLEVTLVHLAVLNVDAGSRRVSVSQQILGGRKVTGRGEHLGSKSVPVRVQTPIKPLFKQPQFIVLPGFGLA